MRKMGRYALGPRISKCHKEDVLYFNRDGEPKLGKMGREALEPRIVKCDKENVAYFSKDLEGLQIGENGPGGTEAQN